MAEEAKAIINVNDLIQFFDNQEAGWSREVQVRKCWALALEPDVAKVGVE